MPYSDKLRRWIPQHFREDGYRAFIDGLGALLDELEEQLDRFFSETLLETATTDSLDVHRKSGLKD